VTERHATRLLTERVVKFHPWCLGADHEVQLGFAGGVSVKSTQPEAENFGLSVLSLVDRGTAAAREKAMYLWAGLPATKKLVPGNEHESL
jgi:hypothetical protein